MFLNLRTKWFRLLSFLQCKILIRYFVCLLDATLAVAESKSTEPGDFPSLRFKFYLMWTFWCNILNSVVTSINKFFLGRPIPNVSNTACLLHCVKRYSGPHFSAFELNTERYGVSVRIQSECGKMRTRITPNTDTFYAVLFVEKH